MLLGDSRMGEFVCLCADDETNGMERNGTSRTQHICRWHCSNHCLPVHSFAFYDQIKNKKPFASASLVSFDVCKAFSIRYTACHRRRYFHFLVILCCWLISANKYIPMNEFTTHKPLQIRATHKRDRQSEKANKLNAKRIKDATQSDLKAENEI